MATRAAKLSLIGRTFAQLTREFSFPLVVALIWAFAAAAPADRNLAGTISRFSTAFFFVSWLSGQLFRVSKQVRTEHTLTGISRRLEDVMTGLQEAAKDMAGWATGGNSWAYLLPTNPTETGLSQLMTQAEGTYPLYDLKIRVVDLNIFRENPLEGQTTYNFGELMAGLFHPIGPSVTLQGEESSLNIFFYARNGMWHQLLRGKKIDGNWKWAFRVIRVDMHGNGTPLMSMIPEDFPAPESIDWS